MAGIEPASSELQPDAKTNSATFPEKFVWRREWESNPQRGLNLDRLANDLPCQWRPLHLVGRVGFEPTMLAQPFYRRLP